MKSDEILKLEEIWKIYLMEKVEVPALMDVNVSVHVGDYLAIQGPSGSGKSTLLNIMGCLDTPTEGNVYVDSVLTSNMSENQLARIRRKKIGFVFQTFNLLSGLTALENVTLPMRFEGARVSNARRRAAELLEMVGLGERIKHKPGELSGGERQRVAIARALANDPDIILADEPTGNLDSKSGQVIIDTLEELNKQDKTLVVITHDPAVAARAKERLYIVDGRVVNGRELNHINSKNKKR